MVKMSFNELVYALVAGAGGGLIIKLADHFFKRQEKKVTAKNIIEKNLDPILKASDDLVGKLFDLQRKDFVNVFQKKEESTKGLVTEDLTLCYYFANFWGRIQILRQDSVYVNLNSTKIGKYLQSFFHMLESKDVRILERTLQRAIGESIIVRHDGQLNTMCYFDFWKKYYDEEDPLSNWFNPLFAFLQNLREGNNLQRLLIYGTVVHALLDTLDSKRYYSRERPAWPNKLSIKSRKELRFRFFGKYLTFVRKPKKYYDIKTKPPAKLV